ncbi:hypothetical protein [Microcoleus sp. FACHB-68]|uniref:hypothetical protein n=1 Tax=Microcoleus sp. FACHB-68 TaxID=2692826 RepID=UPI0016821224|nr:hypothetical protein [Microcoleus sp. FACHB-68]MBD1939091.1 hypothetical protein [Microcoleus sp. FACHB-68]
MSGFPLNSAPAARATNWSAPLSVAVTSTAKVLIAANANRTGLTIVNKNPSEMYIRCAPFASLPVTTTAFDRIIPPHYSFTFDSHEVPTTEISALAVGTISGNWTVSESAP